MTMKLVVNKDDVPECSHYVIMEQDQKYKYDYWRYITLDVQEWIGKMRELSRLGIKHYGFKVKDKK